MKPQALRRALAPVPGDARQHAVPMRDGVLLATDVYLPAGGGPFPVLLSRLPYDKDGDEFFMPACARYWRELGYAVVVQDVRGKARSGGELDPQSDGPDAYDTLDWIVAQTWSRGQVAMIGDSYAGFTQWSAAEARHPALVAITPRVATHNRDEMRCHAGVFELESSVYWAAETAIDEYLYDFPEPFDWSVRPVGDVLTHEIGPRRPRFIDEWVRRWEDGAGVEDIGPSVSPSLPVLHLSGLFDTSVAAHFRSWELARSSDAGHHLVLDCVDHSWRGLATSGGDKGVLEEEPEFLVRYHAQVAEFLDGVFSGNAAEIPCVRWRPALDVPWRQSASWPPPDAAEQTWWAVDGGLESEPAAAPATVSWSHDPADPVPSRHHPFHELSERADLADLAGRPDVVSFTSAPVREMVELAGTATFTCELSSTAPRSAIVVTLLDVTPQGQHWEVRTGRLLVFPGDQPSAYTVDLGPVAYQFMPGHRLALRVSSSLFPRLALESGNESSTWREWDPTATVQTMTVGGERGARFSCAVYDEGRAPS